MLTLINFPRKLLIALLFLTILGLLIFASSVLITCYSLTWCLDKAIDWLKGGESKVENETPKT